MRTRHADPRIIFFLVNVRLTEVSFDYTFVTIFDKYLVRKFYGYSTFYVLFIFCFLLFAIFYILSFGFLSDFLFYVTQDKS